MIAPRIRRALRNSLGAVAAVFALAACTGGQQEAGLELEILKTVRDQVKLRLKDKPERPPVTRALLDSLDDTYIEVRVEDSDLLAYLRPLLVKQDSTPGTLTLWVTEDSVTLALREGVLTATRGLRNDMLSASTLVTETGGRMGPRGQGARRYEIAALDNRSEVFTLACTVSDLGPETIEIVELTYQTRHLQEHCESESGLVVNDYWVDSRSGHLWQSRQWAGPTIGYMRIRQLTL
ncbi:YjbF family lipoprotein [Phaeobacter sp. QD34_3]|uniref:YjbF family lipoprotein n=1 Tax=unclassified Phaeobacter TaxID=2621772 RepID=UPI00237F2D74|nr:MULTISPECIES: YjbF family lipoprotein [unclassified Phaeobacter]MDE4134811.1 YjbF family lipoprotein [Phaeobacter sp. QD34_3]MDE4138469.1 YjbF family lipoprotein [Phaeobacter sp. QD34_24]MDE4175198.1 YjbF family lipoprotein [Phaeobacter sp. PT47_59]